MEMTIEWKKIAIYAVVVCIGIWLIYTILLFSGKEQIRIIAEAALQEAVNTDFYQRDNAEAKGVVSQFPSSIKGVYIKNGQAQNKIEFQDSIGIYKAHQLIMQSVLSDIHPLNPDELNGIYQKELSKRSVGGQTGIIYCHDGQSVYSHQDTLFRPDAIFTSVVYLDMDSTLSIQGWVECNRDTMFEYSNIKDACFCFFLFLLILVVGFSLYYLRKGRKASQEVPQPEKKEADFLFSIDKTQKKIYIGGKECVVTETEYLILVLFINASNHFVTQAQIINAVWPNEKSLSKDVLSGRIRIHINSLRKALKDSSYQIQTVRKKGYFLIREGKSI